MAAFRREPALYLTLAATGIRLLCGFLLHLSVEQQALVDAAVTAGFGFVVAFVVRRDGQVAAALGVVQALLALAIGLGLRLAPEQQALIMSFVGAIGAAFARTQMTAQVGPQGSPQP